MSVENRHAVVTGGGTGVGAEIAETMALAGGRVTVMGRSEEPLRKVAKRHRFIGWITCDVTDPKVVKDAFRQARGINGPITIVVANAGTAASVPFAKLTLEQMQAMLSVNLIGVANAWQTAMPDMKAVGWGRMIAVASTAGIKGYPYVAAYCAAKHGVVGLTRALSLELAATGITVNAICPGYVETPMLDRSIANIIERTGSSEVKTRASLTAGNPQKRFIQSDEVAGAALWLCSDAAKSMNGHTLTLSGGEI